MLLLPLAATTPVVQLQLLLFLLLRRTGQYRISKRERKYFEVRAFLSHGLERYVLVVVSV